MAKHAPDIRIRRIYEPRQEDDGARILVDRLWPRGLRKADAELTLWLKEIAPSQQLRKWFGHDPGKFAEFSKRYRAELAHNREAVRQIGEVLEKGPATLLYAAHDTENNHAVVLADFLRKG